MFAHASSFCFVTQWVNGRGRLDCLVLVPNPAFKPHLLESVRLKWKHHEVTFGKFSKQGNVILPLVGRIHNHMIRRVFSSAAAYGFQAQGLE